MLVLPTHQEVEDRANLTHIGVTCAGAAASLLGVVDADLNWTGGDTHLVSLGDLIDRGMHSRDVVDLLLDEPLTVRMAFGSALVLVGVAVTATRPRALTLPADPLEVRERVQDRTVISAWGPPHRAWNPSPTGRPSASRICRPC